MATLHPFTPRDHAPPPTSFSRGELSQMLSVYSRRVISGEWRDYAIDNREGLAMFSVFRDTHESPLFAIVKRPGEPAAPTEYALFRGPEQLEHSTSLKAVLTALEARPRLIQG